MQHIVSIYEIDPFFNYISLLYKFYENTVAWAVVQVNRLYLLYDFIVIEIFDVKLRDLIYDIYRKRLTLIPKSVV